MKYATIFSGLVNVDKNLVGTAVIYKKIADILIQKGYRVTIVVPELPDTAEKQIKFALYSEKGNKALINDSSVVVFGAYPPISPMLYAHEKKKIILTYLWSIAPIGSLEFKDFSDMSKQERLHRYITASYNLSLLLSDKIFCRDEGIARLVKGSLISLGRLNLKNYLSDRSLSRLIEAAPFGIDTKQPVKKKNNLYRGVIEGINKDDFILIWNGGIWNWNDGATLVQAMNYLKGKKIKLVFQGFKHPKKGVEISQAAKECLNLATKLKLKDKTIFFVDSWVPYNERADFLLESNVGVVSSPNIPEANLFFKTRIYDHFWAGLPTLLNDCEAFAPIISQYSLGLVAKTGDPKSWSDNILALYKNPKLIKRIRNNIKAYRKEIEWKETLKPISKYVSKPHHSADDRNNDLIKQSIKINKDIIRKGL